MNKVLILGINGFTGKHLQKYIKKHNLMEKYLFVGIDKYIENKIIKMKYIQQDILDYQQLQKIISSEKPNFIINLIGLFKATEPELILKTNAEISRYLFDIIIKMDFSVKKILLIGSAAEYGRFKKLPIKESNELNPVNSYGLAKVIQTEYAKYYYRNYKINVNIARTFNILGPGISKSLSIGAFINQIKKSNKGDNIYVGNLYTKRDFLDINDVVDAYWKILIHGKNGEVYNVCSGKSYYIMDILKFLIENEKKELNIVVKKEYVKKNDILDSYGDNSKLKNDLGWEMKYNIFDSLKKMLN